MEIFATNWGYTNIVVMQVHTGGGGGAFDFLANKKNEGKWVGVGKF